MLTADESAVVFAESMGCRLSKYWVTGERAGSIAELVTELPGYPDNIAIGSDGRIWIALVSERDRLSEWLSPRAPIVRKLLWHWAMSTCRSNESGPFGEVALAIIG
jgi:sugar lactone lactonase YvrE